MTRGALLFAFNNTHTNYYEMAVATAKRINHFLNLPVTVVTDKWSVTSTDYEFDNIIYVKADSENIKDNKVWINKGRYQAYDLSPYDETLLLDTDYMVNSDTLLKVFDLYDDFMCHDSTSALMDITSSQELLSPFSFTALWATVIAFKKTKRAKQIFDYIKMVQLNYNHFASIHSFVGGLFRNDYALTLALRTVNGHILNKNDFIPWNLVHVGEEVKVYNDNNIPFNTEYTVIKTFQNRGGRTKYEYISVKDSDFHMMNKINFMELVK